jgi:hypothetical protein
MPVDALRFLIPLAGIVAAIFLVWVLRRRER